MRSMKIWITLEDLYVNLFDKYKPKEMSYDEFVNAIVHSWFIERQSLDAHSETYHALQMPSEEDVKLVAQQADVSLNEAREALLFNHNDLALAILELTKK